MGEIAATLFRSLTKFAAIISVMIGFIAIFTVVVSGIVVALNGTVIMDLLSITQIWLPFNIDPILLWLGTAAGLWITYRVAINAYSMISSVISR